MWMDLDSDQTAAANGSPSTRVLVNFALVDTLVSLGDSAGVRFKDSGNTLPLIQTYETVRAWEGVGVDARPHPQLANLDLANVTMIVDLGKSAGLVYAGVTNPTPLAQSYETVRGWLGLANSPQSQVERG